MASVSPSATPPVAASPSPTVSPPLSPQLPAASAPVSSPGAPSPSSVSPLPPATQPSNSSFSSPPPPPALSLPPPPPPPPAVVPPSPPPSSPPPLPSTVPPSTIPQSPPPPSPPPPPATIPPPPIKAPQSSPHQPPPSPPPPTPAKTPELSPPPPPASVSSPKRSPSPPPPPSKLSPVPPPPHAPPKASPPPPPSSDPPIESPLSSSLNGPSANPPSTSVPPPPSKATVPSPPLALSPQSPTAASPTNANSPTPVQNKSTNITPRVKNDSGIGTGVTAGIAIGVGILILSFIGLAVWYTNRRRRKGSRFSSGHIIPTSIGTVPASDSSVVKIRSSAPLIGSSSGSESFYSPNEPPGPGGLGISRLCFTYDDLVKATNGFSADNFLGEGGFGSVYKGRLQDGQEVAVKQLKVGAKQGEREFRAEVDIISRIHHRHLVSLVGYCIAEDRKLLVYDYVPNNTLYFHLHGNGRPVLDWAARVKVAAGAARGLAYLHEDCHPRIIHRDIKSSNILLDNNFEARVSDFGLAKLALDADTHITTRVMGTFGYMAPEYALSGKLTEKSDAYSFGVVLLELITGRKPVDTSQPLGDEGLVEWARPLMSHALEHEDFEGLVDPRFEGNYVKSEMFTMIEAAAACVRHSAAKRPRLGQIVRAFDSFATSDLTNGMRLGESEVFDSAQQSLEIREFQRMRFGSQGSSTEYFTQPTTTTRTSTS